MYTPLTAQEEIENATDIVNAHAPFRVLKSTGASHQATLQALSRGTYAAILAYGEDTEKVGQAIAALTLVAFDIGREAQS